MATDLFEILHEDEDLLVINKPAGLVCHPTKGDERSSLAGRLRLYRGAEEPVHLINRLDRETSGVVCVAKTEYGGARVAAVMGKPCGGEAVLGDRARARG